MICSSIALFLFLNALIANVDECTHLPDDIKLDEEVMKAFEQSYKDARGAGESKWLNYKNTVYIYLHRGGGDPNSKMASFDMDGTLIKTKSGKTFPEDGDDWKFYSDWINVRLDQVSRINKARFVVFTNQNGVGSMKGLGLEQVKRIVEGMSQAMELPSITLVAINNDEFRKPSLGMFTLYEKAFNGDIPVDLEKSFYCGDATGEANSFSDSDKRFAQAIQLPFISANDFLLAKEPMLVEV